jgi:hypothetical protein
MAKRERERWLIACEYSGRVRDAFIRHGHDAMSCDLLPTDVPGPHYRGDVRDIIDQEWDGMVAHPDCTFLCSSGLHWNQNPKSPRFGGAQTETALEFVQLLLDANIPKIALENPIGCIGTRIRPADQCVQPWMFGDDASKSTCFWLKNLPLLVPTKIVPPTYRCRCGERFPETAGEYGCPNCFGDLPAKAIWANQTPSGQNNLGPSKDRWKLRSTTYLGMADAMAATWGTYQGDEL